MSLHTDYQSPQKPHLNFGLFGAYRFTLAMLVFVSHLQAQEHYYYLGNYAVFAFFVLSGYTVAFILETTYFRMENGVRKFAWNRFLRIYPVYWVVLAFTLLLIIAYPQQASRLGAYPFPDNAVTWFCNITLITFFIPLSALVVAVSWSLYNEIICWIMAPKILRSKVFAGSILTIGVVFALMNVGNYYYDPTADYRFSVSMILAGAFMPFCAGVIIFRQRGVVSFPRWNGPLCMLMLPVLLVAVACDVIDDFVLGCYLALFLNMNIVAYLSRVVAPAAKPWVAKADRALGDLSYPLYLVHFPMILVTQACFAEWKINDAKFWMVSVVLTLLASVLLHYTVVRPVERLRKSIKS